jgi:hypothetical protein
MVLSSLQTKEIIARKRKVRRNLRKHLNASSARRPKLSIAISLAFKTTIRICIAHHFKSNPREESTKL